MSGYVFNSQGIAPAVPKIATPFSIGGTGGTLVAAVAGRQLRIIALKIWPNNSTLSEAGVILLKSNNSSGTVITSNWDPTIAGVVFEFPWNPDGWGESDVGEAIFMQIVGGTSPNWRGVMSYLEVTP